jgi:hypothetical protein
MKDQPRITFSRTMSEVAVCIMHGGIYPNPIITIRQSRYPDGDDDVIELHPEQVPTLVKWLQDAAQAMDAAEQTQEEIDA